MACEQEEAAYVAAEAQAVAVEAQIAAMEQQALALWAQAYAAWFIWQDCLQGNQRAAAASQEEREAMRVKQVIARTKLIEYRKSGNPPATD